MTLIVGAVGAQVMGLGHHGFKLALIVGALAAQMVDLGHHGLKMALIVGARGPKWWIWAIIRLNLALIVDAIGPQVVDLGHRRFKMALIVGAMDLQVDSDRENSRFYVVPRWIWASLEV